MHWTREEYLLTDEAAKIDLETVFILLGGTYWAADRPREMVQKSLEHSLCFSLFHRQRQVGFGRVITDRATFSYLCDVIVGADHRGKGLGKWMVACILEHPEICRTRVALFTKDAHGLYEQFGFGQHYYDCMVRPPPKH